MGYATCPSCEAKINVGKPKMGQQIVCPSCDEVLEVVWLSPVELDWPIDDEEYDDDEDTDDEDYDDEDEADDDDF